jgi:hypothetical protein
MVMRSEELQLALFFFWSVTAEEQLEVSSSVAAVAVSSFNKREGGDFIPAGQLPRAKQMISTLESPLSFHFEGLAPLMSARCW